MQAGVRAVLTLAAIKAAVAAFESGDENASDTVERIANACKAAVETTVMRRDAA